MSKKLLDFLELAFVTNISSCSEAIPLSLDFRSFVLITNRFGMVEDFFRLDYSNTKCEQRLAFQFVCIGFVKS